MHQGKIEIRPHHEHVFLGCGRPCEVVFCRAEGRGCVELEIHEDADDARVRVREQGGRLSIRIEGNGQEHGGIRHGVTFLVGDALLRKLDLSLVQALLRMDVPVAEHLVLKAVESDVVIRPEAFERGAAIDLVNGSVEMVAPQRCELRFKAVQARGVLDLSSYAGTIRRLKMISRGCVFTRKSLDQTTDRCVADLSVIGDDLELISPHEYFGEDAG